MQTLNIGHSASVITEKVLAILPLNSAPIKAIKKTAKDADRFIDATYGKPTRSLIVLSEGLVIGTSVLSETLAQRIKAHGRQPQQSDPLNPDQ